MRKFLTMNHRTDGKLLHIHIANGVPFSNHIAVGINFTDDVREYGTVFMLLAFDPARDGFHYFRIGMLFPGGVNRIGEGSFQGYILATVKANVAASGMAEGI